MTESQKKSFTKIGIIIGVILFIVFFVYNLFAGNYNKMVSYHESISSAWSQVENQYQRLNIKKFKIN